VWRKATEGGRHLETGKKNYIPTLLEEKDIGGKKINERIISREGIGGEGVKELLRKAGEKGNRKEVGGGNECSLEGFEKDQGLGVSGKPQAAVLKEK